MLDDASKAFIAEQLDQLARDRSGVEADHARLFRLQDLLNLLLQTYRKHAHSKQHGACGLFGRCDLARQEQDQEAELLDLLSHLAETHPTLTIHLTPRISE